MRLIARFAQEKKDFFEIITVYDERTIKEYLNKKDPALISIVKEYPAVAWFERKISDDFGIKILYSLDMRPLVKHEHFPKNTFPMLKKFQETMLTHETIGNFREDENHGVIIGPTHPYHLESVQLQLFESKGNILHFELMPFYKHRGIEKMLEGMTLEDARVVVERISAPQTIAYQTAFLDIELQAAKKTLPSIIRKRHVFLLELERIINHLTDLSVLCQLVKFDAGSDFFIRFVEDGRRAMKTLTGHRFGFSAVRVDSEFLDMDEVYDFLLLLDKELLRFEKWIVKKDKILGSMLLLAQIPKQKVLDYGLVGIMARSSGIRLDRRESDEFFEKHDFYMNTEEGGDTFSRFNIRILEIFTSLRMMRNLVKNNVFPFFLGTVIDGEYFSYVESTTGELMMYVSLKNGLIDRFFLRDPSLLNAQVLPYCIKNSKVSDLALITKGIPLNVSAIDL